MKTLKSKISMFSMKSGFKQPAAEGDPEREGLLCKNEDGDVAFKTGDEERKVRGSFVFQTHSRARQPYAHMDHYRDNHNWQEDIWMEGPREEAEDLDLNNITNMAHKMKLVKEKAEKLRAALSKLAVKGGMRIFTIDGREVKEEVVGGGAGVEETRHDDHLAVVLYRTPVFARTMSLLACLSMMPDNVIERVIAKLDDFNIACLAATCRRFRLLSLAFRPRAPNIPVRITLPFAFARDALKATRGDRYVPMGALIGLPGKFSRHPLAYVTWFKSHIPQKYPDQSVVSEWAEICWTPEIHSLGKMHNVLSMVLKKSNDRRPELMGGYHIWSQTQYMSDFRTIAEMNGMIMGNARIDKLQHVRNRSMLD